MTTRMLIDARHREETRVAVVKGNRIEEFDFESAEHKQIKGNIYLAKVTRVEPSLQAAFVEYGGNRHGFLAFSEIHPDYYQIPKEDREALLREEAEYASAQAALRAEEEIESLEGEVEDVRPPEPLGDDGEHDDADADLHHDDDRDDDDDADDHGDREGGDSDEESSDATHQRDRRARGRRRGKRNGQDRNNQDRSDDAPDFRRSLHRRYKIQDVIRRRQVLLVQVVKEERGNKGAALTSYLSLAGRYCVLMPNSSHGGGISRKISNGSDRKRLKSIIDELGLPATMGCIVRTAGLERTKTEIKRDFDYLARLWDEIRERTLKSEAPALIHSDSDLIKRAIRDIYNSNIEEVAVEGDEGYRAAKDFMKLLMPSHARRVKHYADAVPLFQRYGAEDQLAAMYQPVVPLKSGGYLVINPTEALVSIDINSGRSTREHNIEQTALNTNLEAAYEIARQLRLRDMAGLVVIDFIDMDVGSHVRKVERAMRDALKNDRARIQVGRISGFGLMEMSRQRLRTGVLEASTRECPHCEGTGLVRTASSSGLSALRLLEEEAARGRGSRLVLRASQEATIYVLNHKRSELSEIEERFGVAIEVQPDGHTEGARMSVEYSGAPPANIVRLAPIIDDEDDDIDDDIVDESYGEDGRDERNDQRDDADGRPRRKRGRRRRRGRGDDRGGADHGGQSRTDDAESTDDAGDDDREGDTAESGDDRGRDSDRESGRKRRRGRRGGRGRRGDSTTDQSGPDSGEAGGDDQRDDADADNAAEIVADAADTAEAPPKAKRATRSSRKKAEAPVAEDDVADNVAADDTVTGTSPDAGADGDAGAPAKPKRRSRKATAASDAAAVETVEDAAPVEKPKRASRAKKPAPEAATPAASDGDDAALVSADGEAAASGGERRRGWWNRTFG